MDFSGQTLRHVELKHHNLPIGTGDRDKARFYGSELTGGIDFSNATFYKPNFSYADFSNSYHFLDADCGIKGPDFHGAKLQKASFFGANLGFANLSGANMERIETFRITDFTGADLSGANMARTSHDGTRFCYANLRGAKLINADLRSVHMDGADMRGTDLTGVKFSEKTGLSGIKIDAHRNSARKLNARPWISLQDRRSLRKPCSSIQNIFWAGI